LAAPAFAAAGIAFLNLLLIWFVLPESLTLEARQNLKENPRRRFSIPLLLETLKTPVLGKLLIIVLFYSFAFTMFETGFSLFAKLRFGLDARQRGYILAFVGVLLAAVQGGGVGLLTKRFAEPRLVIAASAIVALSLAAWGFSPSVLFLVLVMAPLSIGAGVMGPVVRSLLSKSVAKEAIGGTLGLSTSLESFNRIVSPVVAALLIDSVATWAPGLISAVIVAGVCAFALVSLRPA
jgi:DHA1 family tetracycline resistance protein-like MFS transporter